jgi:hypothetical protein
LLLVVTGIPPLQSSVVVLSLQLIPERKSEGGFIKARWIIDRVEDAGFVQSIAGELSAGTKTRLLF